MPAAPVSIADLLAEAQRRRLWPEVELELESTVTPSAEATVELQPPTECLARSGLDTPCSSAQALLLESLEALQKEAEQALGTRIIAARPQLEQLNAMLRCPIVGSESKAMWSMLDELEDQLEALLR